MGIHLIHGKLGQYGVHLFLLGCHKIVIYQGEKSDRLNGSSTGAELQRKEKQDEWEADIFRRSAQGRWTTGHYEGRAAGWASLR